MPIDLASDLGRIIDDAAGVSVAATYTPQGGGPVALRLLRVAPEPVTGFGDAYVGSAIDSFVLRTADVASPEAGDAIAVGAETFTVQGVPVRAPHGLTWRIEAWRGDPVVLDTEIVLQRAATAANGFGEQIPTWAELATVDAAMAPVSDEERLRAGIVESRQAAIFTIRRSAGVADLSAEDRVLLGSEAWSITGVTDRGRGQWLEIMAELAT